jgi:glycosyltransferase involved in cell wall biosynthesis
MKIGINASFARKANTGIGQVTVNFLQKLIEIQKHLHGSRGKSKGHEFFLYLEEDLPKNIKLPRSIKKRIFLPLWKRDDLIRKIWWEKNLLPRKVKKDKCDIFLSLYQSATVFENEIRHIMLVHDIIPKLFPEYLNNSRKKIYQKLIEKALKKAEKIIAVSCKTEKDLIKHLDIDPAKISVSYIDTDEIYKKEVSLKEKQRVLKKYGLNEGYIYAGGGLETRKNIEGILHAYRILAEKNKTEHFVQNFPNLVISGKLMPELAPLVTDATKIVKELNLKKKVKLLDFVSQKDLPALYQSALFFFYPSFYEGFGLPVLEAMNQGTPVIASKRASLPEVGQDAVLYCNPEDIQEMSSVMKKVLLEDRIRKILSERGKQRAKKFSWDKFVNNILNIINS